MNIQCNCCGSVFSKVKLKEFKKTLQPTGTDILVYGCRICHKGNWERNMKNYVKWNNLEGSVIY